MAIYPILKAELVNYRGGRARFCAHPDKVGMLVVIRRRHNSPAPYHWRQTMSPSQARVLYRKLAKEGWVKP